MFEILVLEMEKMMTHRSLSGDNNLFTKRNIYEIRKEKHVLSSI